MSMPRVRSTQPKPNSMHRTQRTIQDGEYEKRSTEMRTVNGARLQGARHHVGFQIRSFAPNLPIGSKKKQIPTRIGEVRFLSPVSSPRTFFSTGSVPFRDDALIAEGEITVKLTKLTRARMVRNGLMQALLLLIQLRHVRAEPLVSP